MTAFANHLFEESALNRTMVQVVAHDHVTADTRGEAIGERQQPVFDPLLAVSHRSAGLRQLYHDPRW